MRTRKLKSLRQELLRQGVFAVSLPFILLGIISITISGMMLYKHISERNEAIVEQGALQVEHQIRELESDVRTLAGNITGHSTPKVYLQNFLVTHPHYSSIWLTDSSGKVIAAEPSSYQLKGMDRSGSEAFRFSQSGVDESHFSNTFISYELQEPVVTISYPLNGGVIAIEYRVSDLNRYIGQVDKGRSFSMVLTDNTGTWLTHPDSDKLQQREIDPNSSYFRSIESGGKRDSQFVRFAGKLSTFFVRKNSRSGWYVTIYQPVTAVVDPLLLQGGILLLFGLFLIGFSLYRNRAMINNTIAPIEHFIGVADSVSKGEYSRLLPPLNFEEFHTLAKAFDAMIQGIQTREKEQNSLWKQLIQSQKMEVMGSLAGGIAHDFNNILTAIGGFAELLTEEQFDESLRIEYATEILNTTGRAAALTRQLLTFSRKEDIKIDTVEVVGCITSLISMLRRIVGEDVELVCVSKIKAGYILVDKHHLEQVVLNFTVNAADALRENLTKQPKIEILLEKEDKTIVLSVIDNGPGIPKEVLSHIFEPFFTTKPVGKGTGMGLATVRGIIEKHGAELCVDTDENGTAFITRWKESSVSNIDSVESLKQDNIMKYRILLADDEPLLRKVGTAMLRQLGHEIVEAKDGLEALEILEGDSTFDLLMTDMIMPGGISGEQLIKQAHELYPDLKVIVLSGYTDNQLAEFTPDDDVVFLAKPFKLDQLRDILAERFPTA